MTAPSDTAVVDRNSTPAANDANLTRQAPLDALRGLIMVAMALDHANAFIAHAHPPPELWSAPTRSAEALAFVTRFVTHFAAPGFFFLMGASMALFAAARRRLGWSEGAIVRHFLLRGALLIALQLLVENPAWQIGSGPIFRRDVFLSYLGVLYGLGAAMIAGAFLMRLPAFALLGLGLAAEAATELAVTALQSAGARPGLLMRLLLVADRASDVTVYYPLVPWLGVALWGMAFGQLLVRERARAYRIAALAGAMLLALFFGLRAAGGIGNMQPPAQSGWIAFLNVVKYPPSGVFLALTLSADLLLLAFLERAESWLARWGQPLLAFGRSPLFFYIAHLYLYGLIGLALGSRGTGIVRMYPFWLLGLALLYPLCRLYGRFKLRRPPGSLWRLL